MKNQALPKAIGVTGASRGIGAATAIELARRGFMVACLNRNGLATECPEGISEDVSSRLVGVQCDIRDEESVQRALQQANDLGSGLFGVINNAGIANGGPSDTYALKDFEETLRTNVIGTFSVCQSAYPFLAANGGGIIVNIGSFWDRIGGKRYAAYCASKAAVAAISRALAVEWAKKNIRVLDVAPGYVRTEMTADHLDQQAMQEHLKGRIPRGYPGEPGDIARFVASIFVENNSYLTGTTIYIDGAQGISP